MEATLSVSPAGILHLPPELLEIVLDLLGRKDLLSLALTCSPLRDAIIPRHLHFRVIVASEFHAPLWAYLAARPDLARNVHQLTLYNRSEVAHFRDRPKMYLPPCFKIIEGLGLLCAMRPLLMQCGLNADGRELERTALAMALKSMIGLRSLSIRASGCVLADDIAAGRDLFSLACRAVPNIETLRVTWSRPVYAPDFFELFPYPTPALHPVFTMHALRSLEFPDLWMDAPIWPVFCEMLSHSPQLRVLSLPVFMPAFSDSGEVVNHAAEMPHLSCLRRLTVPPAMSNVDVQEALLAYLLRDPPVSDLRWGCAIQLPDFDAPFPTLPSLRTLRDTDSFFVARFLHNREPGSVKLRALESIAFYFDPDRLLRALEALDSKSLRRLHVACVDSTRTLRTLSRMFPALEELSLPGWCSWTRPHPVARAARRFWRAISFAPARGEPMRINWRRMSVDKALKLFPRLRSVHSVDVGDSQLNVTRGRSKQRHPRDPPPGAAKTVASLRKRYPRLRTVNGWKLDPSESIGSRLIRAGILYPG
ncbi:unnamed protein product [Peniophora sp. CBMAI 1063]|nr:unnamed protein product [Peniophora sp. CBMAI 1063]